jgi:hypothetical protein
MDRALERHEEAKKALYRPDGTPKYVEDEMRERQRGLEQGFQDELGGIELDIENALAAATGDAFEAENRDFVGVLTTAELELANARRAFVAGDCQSLPLDELTNRCQAVLMGGDRATMFLLAHYAGQRVGPPDPREDTQEEADLREAVAGLKRKLDPARESKLKEARASVEELEKAKLQLAWRRQGARTASEGQRTRRLTTWRRRGTLTG